jgi:hypothetical protein
LAGIYALNKQYLYNLFNKILAPFALITCHAGDRVPLVTLSSLGSFLFECDGAGDGIRTRDSLLGRQELFR